MSENNQCHFCGLPDERIIDETETCLVIRDLYPVTPLHTLIITKRHVASYFDMSDQERQDIQKLVDKHQQRIGKEDETVSGFNVGINCGEDAGQTVMHCHVHLIPRRKGDVEDPRGGVRGVIPDKQSY
jgi:diadenosine tetraphosphate (Ap4A) HIT family hydrolase